MRELFSKFGDNFNGQRVKKLQDLRSTGVIVPLDDGIIISPDAKIGAGTVISAGCVIAEGCVIGENCQLGYGSRLERATLEDGVILHQCVNISSSTVGSGCVLYANSYLSGVTMGVDCEIKSCYITDSIIGDTVSIGPFSHIRPNCTIADNVKIGDFVEVKNSKLGEAVHAAHLTYLGDIDCGARVNFGCGVAVANFNGKEKFRTVIGDDAFVGCNTVLVSPVKLGAGAYTASGSVVTDDVPQDAVVIARARPVIKEGMAKKYRRNL